ncbi:hypothetical protein [Bacillus testis]|uniref:hypothetical protein n=1 Tax=Bacillus testis TaxID=1622072 RepID=UPI00067EBAF3|nr:hypothetical protein [Bacillus testis]
MAEKPIFKKYIHGHRFEYSKDTIKVYLSLDEAFNDLSKMDRYIQLSMFHKGLRYNLKNTYTLTPANNHLFKKDIQLCAKIGTVEYLFRNVKQHKEATYVTTGLLKINNERLTEMEVIRSPEIKKYYSPFIQDKTSNGHLEKDVFAYMVRFFNKMTLNFSAINAKTDYNSLLEAITNKFGICEEEIKEIYIKWMLIPT